MMARQLLDTMRENERLRLQLEKDLQTMIKVDETEEYLLAREIYDIRYALSNKHSATDYRLTRGIMADCQTCKTTPCSCGYATQNPEAYKDILMLGVKPTKHPSKD